MSYQDWTEQQKQQVKAWIAEQDTRDTVKLRGRLTHTPVVDFKEWTSERPRNMITVQVEKELLGIATTYGITKQDTIAQALAKITNDKDELIFRMDYLFLKRIDVTGLDVITVYHQDPIYGQSPAEEMGLGSVTGDDIEAVIRG